jgi:hypothetical protein
MTTKPHPLTPSPKREGEFEIKKVVCPETDNCPKMGIQRNAMIMDDCFKIIFFFANRLSGFEPWYFNRFAQVPCDLLRRSVL